MKGATKAAMGRILARYKAQRRAFYTKTALNEELEKKKKEEEE